MRGWKKLREMEENKANSFLLNSDASSLLAFRKLKTRVVKIGVDLLFEKETY